MNTQPLPGMFRENAVWAGVYAYWIVEGRKPDAAFETANRVVEEFRACHSVPVVVLGYTGPLQDMLWGALYAQIIMLKTPANAVIFADDAMARLRQGTASTQEDVGTVGRATAPRMRTVPILELVFQAILPLFEACWSVDGQRCPCCEVLVKDDESGLPRLNVFKFPHAKTCIFLLVDSQLHAHRTHESTKEVYGDRESPETIDLTAEKVVLRSEEK